jgi:hypothetical protein
MITSLLILFMYSIVKDVYIWVLHHYNHRSSFFWFEGISDTGSYGTGMANV